MDSKILKIIDFSEAKWYNNEQNKMWTKTGTLFFEAPEIFDGIYGKEVDIWSAGIVNYF